MNTEIGIIDYGMSNLLSLQRALEHVGSKVVMVTKPEELKNFGKVILPGVGAFPDGMLNIHSSGFYDEIRNFVEEGKSFFGICLGMQMMLSEGQEMKPTKGLGIVPGICEPLPKSNLTGKRNIIPHVGWEEVYHPEGFENTPLKGSRMHMHCYFVHSFYASIANPEHAMCYSRFGDFEFVSGIKKGNCFGTQFHPEKSGEAGLGILRAFAEM